MYSEFDQSITEKIHEYIRHKEYVYENNGFKGKISREEAFLMREKEKSIKNRVTYSDFCKIILDFALNGQEEYLKTFVAVFKTVDADENGVLDEKEFRKLVSKLNIGLTGGDCDRFLQILDPFDNQQITFSDIVGLFSTELFPGENFTIMQNLSELE